MQIRQPPLEEIEPRLAELNVMLFPAESGLGLAFVKRIVEDYHRGKISVEESIPDVGTTFLISLPAAPPEAHEAG